MYDQCICELCIVFDSLVGFLVKTIILLSYHGAVNACDQQFLVEGVAIQSWLLLELLN